MKATLRNNWVLLKKVFGYNKVLFFLRIKIAILNSVSVILTVLMPMFLLEAVISSDVVGVIQIIAIFALSFFGIMLINNLFSAYERVANEKIYVKIINELLKKAIDLDLSFFDNTKSYDKYDRAFGNCCKVIDSINAIVSSIITSLFNILFIVTLLIWMDLYMFAAILIVITIHFTITNKLKKMDYDFSRLFSEKNKQVNYLYRLFYLPQFVRDVKANNLSDFIFRTKQDFNDDIIGLTVKQVKKKLPLNIASGILGVIESGAVALYFALAVVSQRIVISQYFTYVNAYNQLKNTIMNLSGIYNNLYSNSLFASDYLEFLDSDETLTLNVEGKVLDKVHSIEFIEVSFKYPNSNNYALHNVSFEIAQGDKVAIVGENGAGKTTIIKLLLRLYEPSTGKILINGVNLTEYNTVSLRNELKTLFQDFIIYAFSVGDNIALGKNVDYNKIWNALERVQLRDKIKELRNGLDTPVTSQLYADGIEFSGGEAQKIAISRLYASNSRVQIMDEPTSSLDPYAEYLLYNRLMGESLRDSIVIVISHRLTLTHKMSKIIVISQGQVAEEGSHKDLMALKGIYSKMYNMQAEKYTDT